MGLSLLQAGEGPDVVLVPGLQGDPGIFQPLVTCLPHRRVWGFRLSQGGLAQDTILLRRCLERLGIERARLVAGSYGGQVGLRLRTAVHSLVMVGSFGRWDQVPKPQRLMLRLALNLPSGVLEQRYNARLVARLLADGVPREIAENLSGPGGRALQQRLGSLVGSAESVLTQPTLWLAGKEDPQAPWSSLELEEIWPEVVVQRLQGGHRPYASHPSEFAAVLEQWWASLDASHQEAGSI